MYSISAEGYKNANVAFLTIKPPNEIGVSMKDWKWYRCLKHIRFSFKRNIWHL